MNINPVMGKCPKCTRELRQYEMYCCMSKDCPLKPKVTMNVISGNSKIKELPIV